MLAPIVNAPSPPSFGRSLAGRMDRTRFPNEGQGWNSSVVSRLLEEGNSIRRRQSDQTLDQPEDEDKGRARPILPRRSSDLAPSIPSSAFTGTTSTGAPLVSCTLAPRLSVWTGRVETVPSHGDFPMTVDLEDGAAAVARAVGNPRLRRRIASLTCMECADGYSRNRLFPVNGCMKYFFPLMAQARAWGGKLMDRSDPA